MPSGGGGGGGGAFNGGTVTQPVTINGNGNDGILLKIVNADTTGTTALRIEDAAGRHVVTLATSNDANKSDALDLEIPTSITLDGVYVGFNPLIITGTTGEVTTFRDDGYTQLAPILIKTAAPADAALAAGQCALWFDQTNGAAKLMMKAKQADGTVKTGSVNVQT